MRIEKITLQPFAGTGRGTYEFGPGLNVVQGVNEAGKSTLFRALALVLLVSTATKKSESEWRLEIEPSFPLDGDNAHVELTFDFAGETYELHRTWAKNKAGAVAKLILPSKSTLTDEAAIITELDRILPAKPGTCRSVFLAPQNRLHGIIEDIGSDGITSNRIGDVLRKFRSNADGVSVDEFKSRLDQEISRYTQNWDEARHGPVGGRGIDRPIKRNVGLVLQDYYALEMVKRDLLAAEAVEAKLGALTKRRVEVDTKLAEVEQFLTNHSQAATDAGLRKPLDLDCRTAKVKIQKMRADLEGWAIQEEALMSLSARLPELEATYTKLKTEEEETRATQAARAEKKLHESVLPEHKQLVALTTSLAKTPKITMATVEAIIAAEQQVAYSQTKLSAGKLRLEVIAKSGAKMKLTRDSMPPEDQLLVPGQSQVFTAGGKILLDHPALDITVTSGESLDVGELAAEVKRAEEKRDELLAATAVADGTAAQAKLNKYNEIANELTGQQRKIEGMLGDFTFSELAKRVEGLPPTTAGRDLVVIVEARTNAENDLKATRGDHGKAKGLVDDYVDQWITRDALFDGLAAEISTKDQLQAKIDKFVPLPDDYPNDQVFLAAYQEQMDLSRNLGDQKNALAVEIARVKEPEVPVEDLRDELGEAEEKFTRTHHRSQALTRIQDRVELLDLDCADLFGELQRGLASYLASLTAGEYTDVTSNDGVLPEGLKSEKGNELPLAYLSGGTRDVLTLSMRLVMSGFFLRDTDGFIMLDDPLVDMDPERQERSARALSEFSREQQVILFTCHPSHVGMLKPDRLITL